MAHVVTRLWTTSKLLPRPKSQPCHVPDYVLSLAAEQSLKQIFVYTYEAHGRAQAEAYHEAFHRSFGLLADYPYMGRSADELVNGLRQFTQGAHVIFYMVRDDLVHIEQIFHHRQDVRPHQFDT